jgi:hypothetical protein
MQAGSNQLNDKSMDECGIVLERWINFFLKKAVRDRYNCDYYRYIIQTNHTRKNKKRMILTVYKALGDKLKSPQSFASIMETKDYSMLKFFMGLFKIGTGYSLIHNCKKLGGDTDTFVIKCLSTLTFPPTLVKAFLYGAIENRNMTLITFIVEKMRLDVYVPTHQKTPNTLGIAFVKNDDLELLQWFEEHDYNIHEGQRELLHNAYGRAPRIKKYVLQEQSNTEASDLYMEKIATKALLSGDTDLLQRFSKISLRVTQNTVLKALNQQKYLLYIQALFTRYVEIQRANFIKWNHYGNNADGNPNIFNPWQITRYYNASQYGNSDSIWQCLAANLWKYGTADARVKLTEKGFTA